jgi:elongation factor P--(R)-beta-lysine ligase
VSPDGAWHPAASLAALQARATLLGRIRAFFAAAGVLEVETPACSVHAATDPAVESLRTRFLGPGHPAGLPLYLHSSPEFAMKRLLAAGSGPIYQVCRVYRDGEWGRLHHPEFTLLEWYRPGFDHHRLMDEVAELLVATTGRILPQQRLTYGGLFREHLDLDPHGAAEAELRACAHSQDLPGLETLELPGRDAWLDLLLTHCIEPRLPADTLTFVYDYPAGQAALARVRPGTPPLAERFELYLGPMELANGFHELGDADEQEGRFRADLERRRTRGQVAVPMDRQLLAALRAGLPDCAGVALGLDRLLMWLTGASSLAEVLAFPLDRA